MLRLTDEHGELIRNIFRRKATPTIVRVASRFRRASARGGPVDPEHRCAVAHAPAVLRELKSGSPSLSAVVSEPGTSRRADGVCQHAALARRCGRVGVPYRCHVCIRQERRRAYWADQARKRLKNHGIVDRHGLPLTVTTHAANHHEVTLVQLTFDFYMIEAKPDNLIGDKAYYSDPLDEQLRSPGVDMIAPHMSNRTKRKTQDGRRLRRYERRWIVERFFVWISGNVGSWFAGNTTRQFPRLRTACSPMHPAQTV